MTKVFTLFAIIFVLIISASTSRVSAAPAGVWATVEKTVITCRGANDGIITVSHPNGSLLYNNYETKLNSSGSWVDLSEGGSVDFTALAPGNYHVYLRDKDDVSTEVDLESAGFDLTEPSNACTVLESVRISVTSPTPKPSGETLIIDLLQSDGSALSPSVTINKGTVATDNGGVLTFILDGSSWGLPFGVTYSPNFLLRVTYGGVVLSIERLEVVYSKQGLYGATIDPGEINTNVSYNFKEVEIQNPPGLAKIGIKLPDPPGIVYSEVIYVVNASGTQTFGVELNGDFASAGSGVIGNTLTVAGKTTLNGKLNLSYGTATNLTELAASNATVIYYTGSSNIAAGDIRVGTNGEVLYIANGGGGVITVLGTGMASGHMATLIWAGGVGGTWFVCP